MKSFLKTAAIAVGVAMLPAAAHAQAAAATAAAPAGIAVVDLDAAIGNSAAAQSAATQIQTTYKAQITAAQTRQTALQGELAALRTELETLQKNPAQKAQFDAKVAIFQQKTQAAQAELQRLALPFARPQAYVREQIEAKAEQALKAAMTAKRIAIVLRPEATVAFQPTADLTTDMITQLNALIPSASITPPANWQPGQADQAQPAGR
ncbi:OmpH family outer membrane protein [Rhizorhabdus dicambivorans]|uniref:Outer membrane chaperone Skp n=1 Tax=Rhizorhabdus dicambivorans TaxID=1850238 RepID=A0A2A4FXC1_9SPHN|nr:OmpH family outer membrane protein [Rhizorhabdus dicambivorans]ATE65279.1 outer membrane chaperone Skp [Rhizorhabdus dicambivorans]PCE42397.1 outer membrane chaperone Skp [Rhizorhabdus dicambivorans]